MLLTFLSSGYVDYFHSSVIQHNSGFILETFAIIVVFSSGVKSEVNLNYETEVTDLLKKTVGCCFAHIYIFTHILVLLFTNVTLLCSSLLKSHLVIPFYS